jgi:predicted DNA-binding transcriptional regulator YafY
MYLAAHTAGMEVRILYTNYKGETAWRRIIPKRIWFGKNEWHSEQWLLEAFDVEKNADRDFAMKEIKEWR